MKDTNLQHIENFTHAHDTGTSAREFLNTLTHEEQRELRDTILFIEALQQERDNLDAEAAFSNVFAALPTPVQAHTTTAKTPVPKRSMSWSFIGMFAIPGAFIALMIFISNTSFMGLSSSGSIKGDVTAINTIVASSDIDTSLFNEEDTANKVAIETDYSSDFTATYYDDEL